MNAIRRRSYQERAESLRIRRRIAARRRNPGVLAELEALGYSVELLARWCAVDFREVT